MNDYDKTSQKSILEFAEKLRNKTLLEAVSSKFKKELVKEMINETEKGNKGNFGSLIEDYYFELDKSERNKARPDFHEAKLELKTAGLKPDKKGGFKKFQGRLSLSSINFNKIIDESFDSSSFYYKNKNILIIFYIHDENLPVTEYKIGFIGIFTLKGNYKQTIKNDWEFIKEAVLAGEAHKLGAQHNWNTQNLEASTSGGKAESNFIKQPYSKTEAKKRRFAYKLRFWEKVIQEIINKDASLQTIDNWSEIRKIFNPFIGYKIDEICKDLNYQLGEGKNKFANLTKEIIMKKGNENLSRDLMVSIKSNNAKKDGIIFRTIRINDKNRIQEEISLPAFSDENIKENNWEESEFFKYLNKPFVFVIFKEIDKNNLVFHNIEYYLMNDADIKKAKKVWIDTKSKIIENRKDFIKISDKQDFHVRPHDEKGNGKNSFWINREFVQKVLFR